MRNKAVGVFILFTAGTIIGSAIAREDPPKKQTDEEITKLLVGKWIVDEGDGKTEPKIKGSMNYKKDGTVDAEATIEFGDKAPLKLSISGTWKVKDSVLIATVTKTSAPELIKEGVVSKDNVISIDDKVLKYKDMGGKEKSQKRMKE